MWLSLVERCVRDAEAAGSNPVISTKTKRLPCGDLFVLLVKQMESNRRASKQSKTRDSVLEL